MKSIFFIFLILSTQAIHSTHHHYFSKRQKAIITKLLLKNTQTQPVHNQDITHKLITVITYETQKHTNNTHGSSLAVQNNESAQPEMAPVIAEPIPAPRLKTIHDVIKFFKAGHELPQDPTVFLELISDYFNTHWEYTFYATWKKEYNSMHETEVLAKALIYFAQAYSKDTTYTFYTGYEPYSISYLLETVCKLDQESIFNLP